MKKVKVFILLSIFLLSCSFPSVSFAQTTTPSPSDTLLDRLASIASLLITGNNTVHLNNPKNNFLITENPIFTLIVPDKQVGNSEIQASITRKKDNQTLPALVKKIKDGEFEISFSDTTKVIGLYSLSITAKESSIYTRHILLDFTWGDTQILGSTSSESGGAFMKTFLEKKPEYKTLPVVKRDKNSVHFRKPDGSFEANFSAGPINYKDTDGSWKPIDTTLQQKGDELVGSGTPASIKTDGTVEVNGSTHSQKTTGFGWFDPTTAQFSSVQELPQGKAEGDKFVRETSEYKHVLTMLDTGLKEELTLYKIPSVIASTAKQSISSGEIAASPPAPRNDNLWLVLETEITGVDLPDGEVDKEFKAGNNTFSLPTTKGATENEAPTKRFAKKINNKQYIYTGIEYNWMKNAVYPVIIDPDFTSVAADAEVWGYNSVYATARGTATGSNTTSTQYTGQIFAAGNYQINRTFLKFDTSSIGTGNTVNYANLTLTATGDESTTDLDVQIVKQDWSAQDPISSSNRDAAYDNCLSGTADDSIWRNSAGMSTNTPYASGNLSGAWINRTGATYYCLRSSRDLAGTTPTGAERVRIALSENATPSYRPILAVTYTGGGSSTSDINFSNLDMQGININ